MKKIFLVLLIIVLCSSLWACNSKKEEEQTDATKALSAFSTFPDAISEFSTIDLEGNTITNDIFSEADLTIVNFWGTYCNPCINELPELAKWSESMPDNVQIIGIIVDVESEDSDAYPIAQQIVDETGATYPHLLATEEFDNIIGEIVGIPTTFFVDKDGTIIGDPIVGSDIDGYKQFVEEYLNGQK